MDGDAAHPGYRYGGMWKNKRAGASAKMKKGKKRTGEEKSKDVKSKEQQQLKQSRIGG